MAKTYDVVIIGCGPAGLSAALYIQRAGLSCTVIGKDTGALSKAETIENYFGLPESVSGIKLVENGIAQAKALGADIIKDEVFGISWDGNYDVDCAENKYSAPAVIIATGASRKKIDINGLNEFEGKGVSYCAVCDAFLYRGKDVAVLGSKSYALHEMGHLISNAKSVTLLTDGHEPEFDVPDGVKVIKEKIAAILGEGKLAGAELESGETISFDGLFVALGSAASSDLARKAGAELSGSDIVVDSDMSTGLPGLFAAGDCTGGLLQVSAAVGEGAKAAMSAIKFVKGQRREN